jgi:hypothetical protein
VIEALAAVVLGAAGAAEGLAAELPQAAMLTRAERVRVAGRSGLAM